MFIRQAFYSLHLYNNAILHDKVGKVFSYKLIIVIDLHGLFVPHGESQLRQLNYQSIYVDFFQKSMAERIINYVERL